MKHEIVLPKCGVSMDEGTIHVWYKKEGDRVVRGDLVFELETDKVNVQIESEHEGYLTKILIKEGETAPVGTAVAIITSELQENIRKDYEAPAPVGAVAAIITSGLKESVCNTTENPPPIEVAPEPYRKFATPWARKKAREFAIDIAAVQASGQSGVVVGQDVDKYAEAGQATMAGAANVNSEKTKAVSVIPYQGMRKAIGEKLQSSLREKPHFYLRCEVEVDRLLALKRLVLKNKSVKVSISSMLVFLIARALTSHPMVNSRFCNGGIELIREINVGLAVGIDQGLVVPVIRNAQERSLLELNEEAGRLIAKAHKGGLTSQDLDGGTITLSNLGMYDISEYAAIINAPESAIIAVGKIESKLYFDTDMQVKEKQVMQITMSCDHRVIDGVAGARFLSDLKKVIEEPTRALC